MKLRMSEYEEMMGADIIEHEIMTHASYSKPPPARDLPSVTDLPPNTDLSDSDNIKYEEADINHKEHMTQYRDRRSSFGFTR